MSLAQTRSHQINYASASSGSPAHMSVERFKTMAKVDLAHVAYKGVPPSTISVVSGETSLTITTVLLGSPT